MQMMAPDPSIDDGASTPENYLFNGPVQCCTGRPCSLLYMEN